MNISEMKNTPRLRGVFLDVIPRQLNGFQPLDTKIIAKKLQKSNISAVLEVQKNCVPQRYAVYSVTLNTTGVKA